MLISFQGVLKFEGRFALLPSGGASLQSARRAFSAFLAPSEGKKRSLARCIAQPASESERILRKVGDLFLDRYYANMGGKRNWLLSQRM